MGMKRTPLTRKTPLKPVSDRAKKEAVEWANTKIKRMFMLKDKYGFVPCEHCCRKTNSYSLFDFPDAHHNNHNRRDNTLENCRIVRRICHQYITDNNVKDVPSLL